MHCPVRSGTFEPSGTVLRSTRRSLITKRIVEAGQRRAEIATAALLVITAAASIHGGILYKAVLSAPDYLAGVFPNRGPLVLFEIVILPAWLFFTGFNMPEAANGRSMATAG